MGYISIVRSLYFRNFSASFLTTFLSPEIERLLTYMFPFHYHGFIIIIIIVVVVVIEACYSLSVLIYAL